MSNTKSLKPNVINLMDRIRRKPPELKIDVPGPAATQPSNEPVSYVVPNGKPKVVFAIGSGKTGKSTLLRWMAERASEQEGTILATLAPNQTMKHYFPSTLVPSGNSTAAGAAFLETLCDTAAESKVTIILDFPGDDTALLHLLDQGNDLASMLEQHDVEPVALFTLSPRVEDLTALAQLAARGFVPKATALVMNMGITADPTLPAAPEFDTVSEHSVYQAAVDRGAAIVWMPRLYAAKSIEERRLLFKAARSGDDLGPSDRSRTHHWLGAMDGAFAPIASWLP